MTFEAFIFIYRYVFQRDYSATPLVGAGFRGDLRGDSAAVQPP